MPSPTSTTARAGRRPGSRPGRWAATATSLRNSTARRQTGRRSTSTPTSRSRAPTSTSAPTCTSEPGSTTTHLSIGPAGGNGNLDFDYDAFFDGVSADGSKVWLDTDEVLTADDTDESFDVYERSGASITRISIGSDGRQRRIRRVLRRGIGKRLASVLRHAGADGRRRTPTVDPTYMSAPSGATTLMSVGPARRQRRPVLLVRRHHERRPQPLLDIPRAAHRRRHRLLG